ncbi:MAG: RNA polymerase factor sigma-54, partial [Chitinophagaceae bacterium]|nr:RNA polymerase factor sigma-54 [Chitinophagaceae bacterium]
MALSQGLRQKQQLKMLPQQIQLMKLLQVPTAYLEERIKEEMEENPALELAAGEDESWEQQQELTAGDETDDRVQEVDEESDPFDLDTWEVDDYADTDDVAEYKLRDDNYPEFDDKQVIPVKVETSFHDILIDQLGMLDLSEEDRRIAEQIVGSIDDDGYLRREVASIVDDLAFRQSIYTDEEKVRSLIERIQQFDPPGVCARDLQECLYIQLRRQAAEGKDVIHALEIITHHFEEFTRKHYDKIEKALGLTDEQLKEVMGHITKLNPRPGGQAATDTANNNYIVPDFFIVNNAGILELTLNSKNAPELRISNDYKDMLREYEKGSKKDKRQKEAVGFIKQKIDSAKWFIDIIKQRQETLFNTMHAIMDRQHDFFLTGDETNLKPMILKDIAEVTGLDISTVSRVANSKYVQTEFGTFLLKFFFSEGMSTDSGEEVSTREVKKILSELVEAEDKHKPLSDDV